VLSHVRKCTGLGGGQIGTSPFNNFYSNHLKGTKHEKARDALLAQVEAAVLRGGGATRSALAMQILAQRAGLVPSAELPQIELQPVGSEPLGSPITRSSVWSSAHPDQPATKQEILDERLGSGAYLVNDDESLAECRHRLCPRRKPQLIHLANPNWLQNACSHYQTTWECVRPAVRREHLRPCVCGAEY